VITRIITGALALFATAALAAVQAPEGAGQPRTAPRPNPQLPAPTATAGQTKTTLVGCLYREAQVPGRTPNAAERAGVRQDYILADATTSSATAATAQPGATAGATGTSGTVPATGNMYKVEDVPDERLEVLVGKRVELTGRIDPEGPPAAAGRPGATTGAPTPDGGPGPDRINLPEFEASSIQEISGTCPATPAPRK
jgi:hypothetical protein